jgi:hypothetical protein
MKTLESEEVHLWEYDTDGNESDYSNIIYLINGQWGDAFCISRLSRENAQDAIGGG